MSFNRLRRVGTIFLTTTIIFGGSACSTHSKDYATAMVDSPIPKGFVPNPPPVNGSYKLELINCIDAEGVIGGNCHGPNDIPLANAPAIALSNDGHGNYYSDLEWSNNNGRSSFNIPNNSSQTLLNHPQTIIVEMPDGHQIIVCPIAPYVDGNYGPDSPEIQGMWTEAACMTPVQSG